MMYADIDTEMGGFDECYYSDPNTYRYEWAHPGSFANLHDNLPRFPKYFKFNNGDNNKKEWSAPPLMEIRLFKLQKKVTEN